MANGLGPLNNLRGFYRSATQMIIIYYSLYAAAEVHTVPFFRSSLVLPYLPWSLEK